MGEIRYNFVISTYLIIMSLITKLQNKMYFIKIITNIIKMYFIKKIKLN